jgi:hypothetical protein
VLHLLLELAFNLKSKIYIGITANFISINAKIIKYLTTKDLIL